MTARNFITATSLAAIVLASAPAYAEGTAQGTSITNNVTVSYQVGGVAQNTVSASDSFVVDRKINLSVSESTGTATSVSPGQAGAVTVFTVTNSSNDTLDLGLAASQQSSGAAKYSGNDNFNVTGLTVYRETNGAAGLQTGAGGDTVVAYLDEVAPDQNVTVYVVGAVPLGQNSGDVATVVLTATAQDDAGSAITQTTGANTDGVDTVFADTLATGGNTARDGKALDRGDFIVSAASLAALKNSVIISDPVNGTASPKMIPGATVQYCIVVSNATGSATATNVTLSDTLPVQTTFDAAYGIKVNGNASGGRAAGVAVSWAHRPAGSRLSWLEKLELRDDRVDDAVPGLPGLVGGAPFLVSGNARSRRVVNSLSVNWSPVTSAGGAWRDRAELALFWGGRYASQRFGADDVKGLSNLVGADVRFDLSDKIDIGASASVRHNLGARAVQYSGGPNIGVTPFENGWLSIGYNIVGFRDRDFEEARYTRAGLYVTMRFKFDQLTLQRLVGNAR